MKITHKLKLLLLFGIGWLTGNYCEKINSVQDLVKRVKDFLDFIDYQILISELSYYQKICLICFIKGFLGSAYLALLYKVFV